MTARRLLTPRLVGAALAVLVIAAIALDTTYKDSAEPREGSRDTFDAATFGPKTYPKVADTLERKAVPIQKLVPALVKDQVAASKRYGNREGNSSYNFAASGRGVAGAARGGLLPVKVRGVPASTRVSIQIGPAISGTALRDAVGFIHFNDRQFVNQVDYSEAATALNEEVKKRVLKDVDATSLKGQRVDFVGAFSLLTPSVVTVVPVKLEAGR